MTAKEQLDALEDRLTEVYKAIDAFHARNKRISKTVKVNRKRTNLQRKHAKIVKAYAKLNTASMDKVHQFWVDTEEAFDMCLNIEAFIR